MRDRIHQLIRKHPNTLSIVACFVILTIALVGNIIQHRNLKSLEADQAKAAYELAQENVAPPVPDVPTDISLDNIPDDSFLPPQTGKLIRANLVTMQLTQYENGQLVGTPIKILAKGKKGSVWETPGGTYPITDTDDDYYSDQAGVYFPYTLHLFGNYMIHGIPHDKNNHDLNYNTAGDIRLSDADAQTLFEWADADTRVSIYSNSTVKPEALSSASTYVTASGQTMPRVSAESYVVGDLDTGEIILSSNPDVAHPIASVSKLMTALVSIDTMNQFDFATVTKPETEVYSANKFSPGEKLELSNLIYPLLLPSSNVAAEIIAGNAGRDTFISEMNAQAQKLGMTNTHYEDPSGLSANNVSSAQDLFTLTQYLFKNKAFLWNITLIPTYNAQGHYWKNVSQFLHTPGYAGGKSGQTDQAKQSNVAIFNLPLGESSTPRHIAIIVLRSDDRYTDTLKILNFVKSRVVYASDKNFTITQSDDLSSNITLDFVGDIMLDRGVKYSVKTNFGGDYSELFTNVTSFLKQADLSFGNLEGPASDKGTDLHNLYSFRMDPSVLSVIHAAGFGILNFANNHVGDWTRVAFDDTRARMTAEGLEYTGAGDTKTAAEQPVIETIKGMKIGFIGFTDVGPDSLAATDTQSGILLASDPDFDSIIKNAAKQCDALVVSFHWGVEYQEHTDRQTMLAHAAIDDGATLVVGAHPHVAQAIETYKGGLIAYSLGNFIFDQAFSKETMQGMLLQVVFDARTKTLKLYNKYAIKLSPQFQPQTPALIQ
jgi:D-alanyl-D-alanine carboxypeptidase